MQVPAEQPVPNPSEVAGFRQLFLKEKGVLLTDEEAWDQCRRLVQFVFLVQYALPYLQRSMGGGLPPKSPLDHPSRRAGTRAIAGRAFRPPALCYSGPMQKMTVDSAVFYTADIDRVAEFYQGVLGWDVEYRQGDKFISFMLGNGVRLGIKRAVEEREMPGAQTVFISVAGIEGLYDECQGKELNFHKPLGYLKGFGHNFAVYDPDLNKIEFVERD